MDHAKPKILDRRHTSSLTEEDIDYIAERAAEKAIARMTGMIYQEVGKGVINKLFWIVGISAVGVYVYLKANGYIK